MKIPLNLLFLGGVLKDSMGNVRDVVDISLFKIPHVFLSLPRSSAYKTAVPSKRSFYEYIEGKRIKSVIIYGHRTLCVGQISRVVSKPLGRFIVDCSGACTKQGDSGSAVELVDENFTPLSPARVFIGVVNQRAVHANEVVCTALYTMMDATADLKNANACWYPFGSCQCA